MTYRTLPGTDLRISVLSLGTATFGGSHGFEGWGHVDVAEATRMVDFALEAGINSTNMRSGCRHAVSARFLQAES